MSMLTWVFLFLWENRKLLKINKLDLDIIADYLPEKEDNPRFCFTKTQKALSLLVNTYKQYS